MFDMTKNRVVFGKYAGCKIAKNNERLTIQMEEFDLLDLTVDTVKSISMSNVKNVSINVGSCKDKLVSMGGWGLLGGLAFGTVGAVAGALLGGVGNDEDIYDFDEDEETYSLEIEFKNGESSTVFLDKEYIDVLNKSGIKVDIAVT